MSDPTHPPQPAGDEETCEVCIVGGGPIGLELAAALKREGIDYRHFEAGQIGHTMTWWAPGTRWFSSNERISLCGVPLLTPDQSKATREQYLAYLRQIAEAFALPVRSFEPAVDVERNGDGSFTLVTAPRGRLRKTRCTRVVLATGGTDFPRTLGIEGEDLPHVDGYFRDPHKYFRRRVLIIGGKNSAVEAALRCHHAGARVSLCYRRPRLPEEHIKYWLLPEIKGYFKSGAIRPYFGMIVTRITPTHVTMTPCGEDLLPGGEAIDVEADEVLKLVGYEQDKRLLRRAGIELVGEQQRPVFDERTMETNVAGIYVAGTVICGTQQRFRVFLENCHVHVPRIVSHIQRRPPPDESALVAHAHLQPES